MRVDRLNALARSWEGEPSCEPRQNRARSEPRPPRLTRALFAHLFLTIGFLAEIMAPGLIQTVSELRDGERPRAFDVFLHAPTARNLHDYEKSLERTSVVIKRLRPWVQYTEWRLLADAGEKAVIGRHGWMFYRPSVRHAIARPAADLQADSADPMAAIRSFHDQLMTREIKLLVVPVPNKESIYPAMLANRAENAGVIISEQTRRLLDQMAKYGIAHVDLFEEFRRAKLKESPSLSSRLYLARDTHWSPAGARFAAGAVARQILGNNVIRRFDHTYAERSVTVQRLGDLVEMLQVRRIERLLEPESLKCLQVIESGEKTPYRDAPDSEVLVLRDSFLRIYERDEPGAAGFIAHLARELGQPLTALVNDGGASTLVRQELARRPALLLNKKLVIWEFTERDIRLGIDGWRIVPLSRPKGTSR